MEFEWDEAKNSACFERRGFDFAYAVRAFLDPHRIVAQDRREGLCRGLHGAGFGRSHHFGRKANGKEVADYEHNARQD